MTGEQGSFLSQRRHHRTRASVRIGEVVSRSLITAGGIGTIIAVSGVFVFLLWVVKDLFLGAEVGAGQRVADANHVLRIGCDEYREFAWMLRGDASVELVDLHHHEQLAVRPLAKKLPRLTAASPVPRAQRPSPQTATLQIALGFADGTVRPLDLRFVTSYCEVDGVPPELRKLKPGAVAPWKGGIVERTPIGQFRLQQLELELGAAVPFAPGEAIVSLERAQRADGPVIAALSERGTAAVRVGQLEENLFTGETELTWGPSHPLRLPAHRSNPRHIALTDLGTNLVLVWDNGRLARFSLRSPAAPALAEETDLVPEPDVALTAFGLLLGDSTMLVGDSLGRVSGWFLRNDPDNEVDGTALVRGHVFELADAGAVVCFADSERERTFLAGTADGAVHALFMTSEKRLARVRLGDGLPPAALSIAPKDDAILAATEKGLWTCSFDPRHPEITPGSLFGKVWYERHDGPEYAWQSSSASDDFEKKLSLVPLIFGTIKGTFYSMMFAVPIALLAAIYSSEFLNRRARGRIKPLIEMMASLPSVVLGFLAANIIAPFVEDFVPAALCSFATVPFTVLLGAYLWRLLPHPRAVRWDGSRLWVKTLAVLIGLWLATAVGPLCERVLFDGDLRAWLAGAGSGRSAWVILLLPISAIGTAVALGRWINPWMRRRTVHMDAGRTARFHLLKFAVACLVVPLLATGGGLLLDYLPVWFGGQEIDLRDGIEVAGFQLSPLGVYDQRNALVVGFIMGFAVIPIIYTIAEDALSSVPEHLRAASLGAGATPWQTTTRIVIPTAMSGLFSAIMIGLGRAVGETMIVLMATGNTAVLSLNAFNGFRTLSANIATELPEAPPGSTHYRTLFLAALVLFAMTFVINTLAETVRLRFRKRAHAL